MTVASDTRAERTIVVNRPIQDVFEYLSDGTNNMQWRSGVVQIERTSAAAGAGATYRQVLKGPGGRSIDGDYVITDYSPPRQLGFQVTAGPARPVGRFELTDADGGTEVTFTLDLQPKGFMRLMTPMIASQVRREVAALDNVKTILEH